MNLASLTSCPLDAVLMPFICLVPLVKVLLSLDHPSDKSQRQRLQLFKRPNVVIAMVVIVGMFYYAFVASTPNYYQILGVRKDSQHVEVYEMYKKLTAEAEGRKEREKYDEAFAVVGKAKRRAEYNVYGDIMQMTGESDEIPTVTAVLVQSGFVQVILCACLAAALAIGTPQALLNASFALLLTNFVLELYCRILSPTAFDFVPFMSKMLPFEKVEFLRRLFPPIFATFLLVANMFATNQDVMMRRLFEELMKSNMRLQQSMKYETTRVSYKLKESPGPSCHFTQAADSHSMDDSSEIDLGSVIMRGVGGFMMFYMLYSTYANGE
ncbi:hypothetical protein FOL47_003375 [Perkinsus chesapeaki]|uniref:J domain-containing protein n=1 Tax=Perkinsus chesapeaki TaxID=330153 RepID=A0A7J6M8M1_PERCH|nr:hypothetical protein FOL47_003375 [Perkinsus chesapeaki]